MKPVFILLLSLLFLQGTRAQDDIMKSAASLTSGILLDNYDGLKYYAQNGYLYGDISHAPGFRPMPDGEAKLNNCIIATIKKWIDTGTPH